MRGTGPDAAELMRLHREQLLRFVPLPADEAVDALADEAAQVATELSVEDLQADVQALVTRYEAAHPGHRLIPLRFMATGGEGSPAMAGSMDLPDDDHLVTLILTETSVDVERGEVRSRLLIARRTSSDEE